MLKTLNGVYKKVSFTDLKALFKLENKLCVVGYKLSAEAGAPHYDDIQSGVWSKQGTLSTFNPFTNLQQTEMLMSWFNWRRLGGRRPSSVPYRSFLKFQQALNLVVATQCVDGLINIDGMGKAYELYGNVSQAKCRDNGHELQSWPTLSQDGSSLILCPTCSSVLFPNVEMFGWNSKKSIHNELLALITGADCLINIGADDDLVPFTIMNNKQIPRLPIVCILNDGVLLRDKTSIYKASVGEIVDEIVSETQDEIEKSKIRAGLLQSSQSLAGVMMLLLRLGREQSKYLESNF